MASRSIINRIKTDLRMKHNALDGDISDNIDSCIADLELVGIKVPNDTDCNIANAIKLWCRAYYAKDTAEAAAYLERYNAIKSTLKTSTRYRSDIDADE